MKGGLLLNKFFKGIGFYLVIFIIIVGIVQISGKPAQKVETLEFSKEGIEEVEHCFDCVGRGRQSKSEIHFCLSLCKMSENEIIEMIPNDRILIETDSPYLSPEPNRGKRNDSRNLVYIAEKIANVKNISVEEVQKTTFQNAKKLYNID